ncbi:hypothetical protein ABT275_44765 [Streptomyces sp. NPDC001185]|uniref:hypothetical protein n=1 Tax=Streptomyces sp. NPDC001185 TaxID=3154380 RepID=UPI00332906F6
MRAEGLRRTETMVCTRVVPDSGRMPQAPRPAKHLSGQPYTLPEDAIEWIEVLAALRRDAVTNPRVAPFREHIANACERTLEVLRSNGPGPGETSFGES